MKKKLAGVLAAVMLLGAPMTALAAETDFDATISVVTGENVITVTVPDNAAVYENTNTTLTIPFEGDWTLAAVEHEDGSKQVVNVTEDEITFVVIRGGTYTITKAELSIESDPIPLPPAGENSNGNSGGNSRPQQPKPVEEVKPLPFADVPEDNFFREEIAWAYENGFINGKTADSFQPAGIISRQQIWMILAGMSGETPAHMAEAKAWAMANGVSDGSNPGAAVTRQQLVTLLWRYAEMAGYDLSIDEETSILTYQDGGTVSAYAETAMRWACSMGIVTGTTDGRLNPGSTATRAQFAAILYRFAGPNG